MKNHYKLLGLLFAACGGDDGVRSPDAGHADAGIAGDTPFSARWLLDDRAESNNNAPIAGAAVRIETASGDALEGVTAADGTVTFMVDPEAGPFAITFAKVGVGAVSVLDAASSVGDVYAVLASATNEAITGGITGKQGVGDAVVVSSYGANAVSVKVNTYTDQIRGPGTAQRVVGMELAPAKVPLNITETTSAGGVADLVLPSTPPATITAQTTIQLPTTGAVTGFNRTVTNIYGAPCPVAGVQNNPDDLFGNAFLVTGCGTTTAPDASGRATASLTSFGGAYAVTSGITLFLTSSSPIVDAYVSLPAAGGSVTIPPADAFSVSGARLEDLTWTAAGSSYTTSATFIGTASTNVTPWAIYAPASPTPRKLPTLPSTVALTDLTSETSFDVECDLVLVPQGTPYYQPNIVTTDETLFMTVSGIER